MKSMFLMLAAILLLGACGGGGYYEEECFCDEFGCDCFVYEADPYYKGSASEYDNVF